MNIAVAHPGKIGDLLFALPTARYLCEHHGASVDVYTSPYCRVAIDVIASQPYVRQAAVIEAYVMDHSEMGVQPWEMQVPADRYDQVFQLGFRGHPDRHTIRYVAHQVGLPEPDPDTFELLVPETDVVSARRLRTPYIVITTPPSIGGGALSWHWANAKVSEFVESCPYPVYAVGLPEEWNRYDCAGRFEGLAGLSFVEIAQVMKAAKAVITFSTGLGVLASGALKGTGVPLVCMFDGEIPWETFRLPGAVTCAPHEDLRRIALKERGIDELEQAVARLERERQKLTKTVGGESSEINSLTDAIESLQAQHDAVRHSLDATWLNKEEYRIYAESLTREYEARGMQLDQLKASLAAAEQELVELRAWRESLLTWKIRRLLTRKPV